MIDIHQGGCRCGGVRYPTIGAPIAGTVCRRKFCQWRSGEAAIDKMKGQNKGPP